MAKNLFSLFDDRLKNPNDLVASPPQNLESISEKAEEQEYVLRKIRQFEIVRPKVDFSDFKNFVFFNSALDYFNISGERIINEYPYDGSVEGLETFLDDLDDYQRHLVDVWPRTASHLRFRPSQGFAYVTVNDLGVEAGTSRTAMLNPTTGSWSIEFWAEPPPALTGSNDVMFVVQKASGSLREGYTAFFSGSSLFFRMTSGSVTNEVSAPAIPGQRTYFSCVLDRTSTPKLVLMTGSAEAFPVVAMSASSTIDGNLNFGSVALHIGSGTLGSKVTRPVTGSIDNVRVWSTALTLADVSSSFNTKIFAQPKLLGLWRFNESGSVGSTGFVDPENHVVFDHSGHRLNGRIQNYYTTIRASGSLVPFETPDLILQFNAREVQSFILEQQTSGSAYDRENDNLITRLLPDQFFQLEEYSSTISQDVLKNFLYIVARQFDEIKVRIDQFVKVLRSNYTGFNETPDALLAEVGKFFGWEFTGNFLDKDAFQYILGRNVLANLEANKELDTKLFQIKNEFWRRVLINLMYIYKTKGTRESIEALLRLYGVNKNFVRLKEYGVKPTVGISTFRIHSEKSVAALTFGTGSALNARVFSPSINTRAFAIETRVMFPTTGSHDLPATILSGSIWTLNTASLMAAQLTYQRNSLGDPTGSLTLSSSVGNVFLPNVAIFDSKWYNIAMVADPVSSSLSIDVRKIDNDEVVERYRASVTASLAGVTAQPFVFWVGSSGSKQAEYWMQEARVWNEPLSTIELEDHALNFQSFGTEEVDGLPQVTLHWRMNENMTASSGGALSPVFDFTGQGKAGSGLGFTADKNPYKKFLNEYNFIASPEYGWNEEKIRVISAPAVPIGDNFLDDERVALEFNMIEALNEDISQIMATMDGFNNSIGLPVNKYRAVYADLEVMRFNYFKRLQGRLNFRVFSDMLEFFDRSFIDMIRRLLPVRVVFLGDEFVVESHMLERPKLQWNYRRQEKLFQPEGRIKVLIRD